MTSFEAIFAAFSKFGNTKSDGATITLSQSDKWMKQAGLFNNNLTTDTAIAFNKFKTKTMDKQTYEKFLEALCTEKKLALSEIKSKLVQGGLPGTINTTVASASGAVARLTDTSKYTGAHKERFDQSGKGRGIEGRADVNDNSGYVQGYKNKDTYDETH